jgi:hypothetical protein
MIDVYNLQSIEEAEHVLKQLEEQHKDLMGQIQCIEMVAQSVYKQYRRLGGEPKERNNERI